ncbi:hypothetical protein MSP7336_01845 [Mycobacterium shimoidei]|uniref:Uncharacterized protein n=1 Tax=Mycobacterium shimoidei TaxID=29313 RepID=A0A375YXL2_MYCSH|nr:hypothetical protein [Mycobacterium shimoidei]SRX93606.1 hypothetical protein MSP7336_01845 [Mycobacterium shimoidei]
MDDTGAEIPDFPEFSEIRKLDLPEEAVVSRQLRDDLAGLQEWAGKNPLKHIFGLTIGVGTLCAKSIFEIEKQIIEVRREVRRLSGS